MKTDKIIIFILAVALGYCLATTYKLKRTIADDTELIYHPATTTIDGRSYYSLDGLSDEAVNLLIKLEHTAGGFNVQAM